MTNLNWTGVVYLYPTDNYLTGAFHHHGRDGQHMNTAGWSPSMGVDSAMNRDTQPSTAVDAITPPHHAAGSPLHSKGWLVARLAGALAGTLLFGPSAILLGREARQHAPWLARLLTIGGWMASIGMFLICTALLLKSLQ